MPPNKTPSPDLNDEFNEQETVKRPSPKPPADVAKTPIAPKRAPGRPVELGVMEPITSGSVSTEIPDIPAPEKKAELLPGSTEEDVTPAPPQPVKDPLVVRIPVFSMPDVGADGVEPLSQVPEPPPLSFSSSLSSSQSSLKKRGGSLFEDDDSDEDLFGGGGTSTVNKGKIPAASTKAKPKSNGPPKITAQSGKAGAISRTGIFDVKRGSAMPIDPLTRGDAAGDEGDTTPVPTKDVESVTGATVPGAKKPSPASVFDLGKGNKSGMVFESDDEEDGIFGGPPPLTGKSTTSKPASVSVNTKTAMFDDDDEDDDDLFKWFPRSCFFLEKTHLTLPCPNSFQIFSSN